MTRRAKKGETVTITVSYGYDIHAVQMSKRTYERIKKGISTSKKGDGFYWDGEPDQDWWDFNGGEGGLLKVTTERGGDIYSGHLTDAEVRVEFS